MQGTNPCVMVTDIIGYSRHLDDDADWAVHLLATYRSIVVPLIRSHYGQVSGYDGDSIIATFHGVDDAVQAAIEVQRELSDRLQNSGSGRLRNRIALHCGPVYLQDDTAYGETVDIARRLQVQGGADSICLSAEVYRELGDHYRAMVRPAGQQRTTQKNVGPCYLLSPAVTSQGTPLESLFGRWRRQRPVVAVMASVVSLLLVTGGIYAIVSAGAAKDIRVGIDPPLAYCCADEIMPVLGAVRHSLLDIRQTGDVMLFSETVQPPAEYHVAITGQQQGDQMRIAWSVLRQQDGAQVAGGSQDRRQHGDDAFAKHVARSIVYQLQTRLE